VADTPSKLEKFQAELVALRRSIPEDLHLPSLKVNRLEGFAFLFVVVLSWCWNNSTHRQRGIGWKRWPGEHPRPA
jgi:hypothetical protein